MGLESERRIVVVSKVIDVFFFSGFVYFDELFFLVVIVIWIIYLKK